MALKAKEWVWLPREEQERRAWELSPHECFLLRTLYDYVHPTEEEKAELARKEAEKAARIKAALEAKAAREKAKQEQAGQTPEA